jgi:hypothetical protein
LRRERLVIEHGIDPRAVRVLHNFVDLERFQPRPPLPARPRRALVFSNQVGAGDALMAAAREACAGAGIELAAVGSGSGGRSTLPKRCCRASIWCSPAGGARSKRWRSAPPSSWRTPRVSASW